MSQLLLDDHPAMAPPLAPDSGNGTVHLPAHCGTVAAEDLRVRLVLAADLGGGIIVDASDVESIGQAVLQILAAARREAVAMGQPFGIANPSPAFVDRVTRCRLADAIGLIPREDGQRDDCQKDDIS